MRRRGAVLLLGLLLLFSACSADGGMGGEFSGARAYDDVLLQCALGPRLPGSLASEKARAYLARELAQAGWTVEEQHWVHEGVPLTNLLAKKGRGPVVIIGAHYDCRARADRDPSQAGTPVPGANDGASGVAVLLELARCLNSARLQSEVWLAFFDAEDQGELNGWPWSVGAQHLVQQLTIEPQYVVVVDMVGDAEQTLYWERASTPWLNETIWSLAAEMGYGAHFVPEPKHSIMDDHRPFLERGIPAADIIDFDYPHWHTTADTADKVSAASLERVGRVLQRLIEDAPASLQSEAQADHAWRAP